MRKINGNVLVALLLAGVGLWSWLARPPGNGPADFRRGPIETARSADGEGAWPEPPGRATHQSTVGPAPHLAAGRLSHAPSGCPHNCDHAPLNPLQIGGTAAFPVQPLLALRALKPGDPFTIEAFGRKLSGTLELNQPPDAEGSWAVSARLEGADGAVLTLEQGVRGLRGWLGNATGSVAYSLRGTGDVVQVAHRKITDLVCGTSTPSRVPGTEALARPAVSEIAREATGGGGGDGLDTNAPTAATLALESRPGSPHVLYLDFDGEFVSGTGWNDSSRANGDINAPASSLNCNAAIRYFWRAVSEDFSAFDINVTTSRAVYDATPVSKRMMVIVTDYTASWTDAAGIAALDSFGSSAYWCCWCFTQPGDATAFGMHWFAGTASHEAGHTFGLSHDRVAGDTSSTPDYHKGHAGNAQ